MNKMEEKRKNKKLKTTVKLNAQAYVKAAVVNVDYRTEPKQNIKN